MPRRSESAVPGKKHWWRNNVERHEDDLAWAPTAPFFIATVTASGHPLPGDRYELLPPAIVTIVRALPAMELGEALVVADVTGGVAAYGWRLPTIDMWKFPPRVLEDVVPYLPLDILELAALESSSNDAFVDLNIRDAHWYRTTYMTMSPPGPF